MTQAAQTPPPPSGGATNGSVPPSSTTTPRGRSPWKRWVLFCLRWGIAVFGIWWILANMSFHDRVWVLDEHNRPQSRVLLSPALDSDSSFAVRDPSSQRAVVPRDRVINRPDAHELTVRIDNQSVRAQFLGSDLTPDLRGVRRLLVAPSPHADGIWITPGDVVGGYQPSVPYPRIDQGILSMVWYANPYLLILYALVFPPTFLITSYRWHELLKALDIRLSLARTFVLNMVGAFYNSFMPGSTGGDVLKAYYASKQTPHRTRAVMSVIVDRAIGLLGLVILGGSMAAWQYFASSNHADAATRACGRVALGSLVITAGLVGGLAVMYFTGLRKSLGVDWLLSKLPLQHHVQHAVDVMRIYKKRLWLVTWALLITFPVHITVVLSAALAGKAFVLPIPIAYYFVCVPVIVLASALPLAPQGAGVMEFFAILLMRSYGVTVSQAVALCMAIRLVQISWNLLGGLFVLRGGYHAPTSQERHEMESDDDDASVPVTPAGA